MNNKYIQQVVYSYVCALKKLFPGQSQDLVDISIIPAAKLHEDW